MTTERRILLEASLGASFTNGNRVAILQNGHEIFPAMLDAIASAKSWIYFVTFVYWTGDMAERFAEALAERARAGVDVDVVLDAVGAMRMPAKYVEKMEAAGAHVHWFRPKARWAIWRADHRTHRKILVCDGTIGFTGGVGIAEPWEGDARDPSEWRDTQVSVEGLAVRGLVAGALGNLVDAGCRLDDQAFVRRLTSVSGQLGDAPGELGADAGEPDTHSGHFEDVALLVLVSHASIGLNPAATLQHALIASAQHSVYVTTPYFVPDDETVDLLARAAQRGVHVVIMIPRDHVDERLPYIAGRRRFGELLRAGVEIRRHRTRMVHAKIITIDGETAAIGSANMNQRSLQKDDELTVVIDDTRVTKRLDQQYERDSEGCEGTTLEAWEARPWTHRLVEQILRVVEQQL